MGLPGGPEQPRAVPSSSLARARSPRTARHADIGSRWATISSSRSTGATPLRRCRLQPVGLRQHDGPTAAPSARRWSSVAPACALGPWPTSRSARCGPRIVRPAVLSRSRAPCSRAAWQSSTSTRGGSRLRLRQRRMVSVAHGKAPSGRRAPATRRCGISTGGGACRRNRHAGLGHDLFEAGQARGLAHVSASRRFLCCMARSIAKAQPVARIEPEHHAVEEAPPLGRRPSRTARPSPASATGRRRDRPSAPEPRTGSPVDAHAPSRSPTRRRGAQRRCRSWRGPAGVTTVAATAQSAAPMRVSSG